MFEKRGHEVAITTRAFAQTIELADLFRMKHVPIGEHGGKKLGKIGLAVLNRSWQLIKFAKGKRFDVAMSHNSYAQALAARYLGIPFVTSMDYEHQPANHLCFRLAKKVIVPEFFPDEDLNRFGARHKTCHYRGTKEEIYLADFTPQPDYLTSIGLPKDRVLAIMRPPGTWGLYHHFENPIFEAALEYVAGHKNCHVIFLPRVASQGDMVKERGFPNVVVPDHALDGPNLMHHVDLVISGGGSMNREAAVLGTPTYSLFKGKLAAVDRYLINEGRMTHIDSEEKISLIRVEKKRRNAASMKAKDLVGEVAEMFLVSRGKICKILFGM